MTKEYDRTDLMCGLFGFHSEGLLQDCTKMSCMETRHQRRPQGDEPRTAGLSPSHAQVSSRRGFEKVPPKAKTQAFEWDEAVRMHLDAVDRPPSVAFSPPGGKAKGVGAVSSPASPEAAFPDTGLKPNRARYVRRLSPSQLQPPEDFKKMAPGSQSVPDMSGSIYPIGIRPQNVDTRRVQVPGFLPVEKPDGRIVYRPVAEVEKDGNIVRHQQDEADASISLRYQREIRNGQANSLAVASHPPLQNTLLPGSQAPANEGSSSQPGDTVIAVPKSLGERARADVTAVKPQAIQPKPSSAAPSSQPGSGPPSARKAPSPRPPPVVSKQKTPEKAKLDAELQALQSRGTVSSARESLASPQDSARTFHAFSDHSSPPRDAEEATSQSMLAAQANVPNAPEGTPDF